MQDNNSFHDIATQNKVVCEGPISLSATFKILLCSTFVKILKLTFNKHIGLYCCIRAASAIFGSNVITLKLRLQIGNLPAWIHKKGLLDPVSQSPKEIDKIQRENHSH
jgi:hypothetical protein